MLKNLQHHEQEKRQTFKPMQGNRVKLFVCGPTVY